MGGSGSGRHRWGDTKATVEECRVLDIGEWRRQSLLRRDAWLTVRWSRGERETGSIGAWLIGRDAEEQVCAAVLVYRAGSGEQAREVRETVPIVWRACRYGGERPYFVCPGEDGVPCGRQVLKLYSGREALFLCRHCYELTYESRRESTGNRALRQAQQVRTQLGGSANMLAPFPEKPKGMHWATYERLWERARSAEAVYDRWALGWLQAMERRLDRREQHRRV
jgi:hypothetical protein